MYYAKFVNGHYLKSEVRSDALRMAMFYQVCQSVDMSEFGFIELDGTHTVEDPVVMTLELLKDMGQWRRNLTDPPVF